MRIPLLIIIGGIGFLTWDDIRTNRLHITRYRMQEQGDPGGLRQSEFCFLASFSSCSSLRRSLWGSDSSYPFSRRSTPRTAGFNTADLTAMSESGQTIITMLMLIGGSPGSTAGGMKTTTLCGSSGERAGGFSAQCSIAISLTAGSPIETISQAATIFAM